MIKWLKTLFGKHESQKTVELNLGQEKLASDSEEFVEVLPNISTEQPLLNLYRVGPSFLTYQYSIDEDVAFEITEEEGLMGAYKYRKFAGAIQAIDDNDNFWFLEEEHEKARKLLMEDLKTLAKDHGMIGAYSNLGTLCMSRKEQLKYWEKGAKLGDKSCMVDYAIDLYCDGRTVEGFMVNLNHVTHATTSSAGLTLILDTADLILPVSRSYLDSIKATLSSTRVDEFSTFLVFQSN